MRSGEFRNQPAEGRLRRAAGRLPACPEPRRRPRGQARAGDGRRADRLRSASPLPPMPAPPRSSSPTCTTPCSRPRRPWAPRARSTSRARRPRSRHSPPTKGISTWSSSARQPRRRCAPQSRSTRPLGRIVQVGVTGDLPVPLNLIVGKEIELAGSHRFHAEFAEAVRLIDGGEIDPTPILTGVYPVEKAVDAFRSCRGPDTVREGATLLCVTATETASRQASSDPQCLSASRHAGPAQCRPAQRSNCDRLQEDLGDAELTSPAALVLSVAPPARVNSDRHALDPSRETAAPYTNGRFVLLRRRPRARAKRQERADSS